MKQLLFSLLLIIVVTACSTTKSNSPEALQKKEDVNNKVQAKNYVIEVDQALPMRGRTVSLSYGYDLKVKNDSVFAYLPYFGVATSAPYGGGEGGIKFSEPMKDYQLNQNKKKDGWEVRFNVKTINYNYQFFLNIFDNGNSTISVSSYERDPISFYGHIASQSPSN